MERNKLDRGIRNTPRGISMKLFNTPRYKTKDIMLIVTGISVILVAVIYNL